VFLPEHFFSSNPISAPPQASLENILSFVEGGLSYSLVLVIQPLSLLILLLWIFLISPPCCFLRVAPLRAYPSAGRCPFLRLPFFPFRKEDPVGYALLLIALSTTLDLSPYTDMIYFSFSVCGRAPFLPAMASLPSRHFSLLQSFVGHREPLAVWTKSSCCIGPPVKAKPVKTFS